MAYSDVILATSGLQHYYKCGELTGTTLTDSKGSENLTISGTVTLGANTLVAADNNKTLDTEHGSSGYAYNSSHTQLANGNFSFELWFVTNSASTNIFLLSEGSSSSATPFCSLDIQSGSLLRCYIRSNGGSGVVTATGTTAIDDGKVHHAVMVGDTTAGTFTVYLDGAQEAQTTGYPNATTTTNRFAVGALYRTSASNQAYGYYQHVATYNVALSLATIKAHYQAGVAAKMAFF